MIRLVALRTTDGWDSLRVLGEDYDSFAIFSMACATAVRS